MEKITLILLSVLFGASITLNAQQGSSQFFNQFGQTVKENSQKINFTKTEIESFEQNAPPNTAQSTVTTDVVSDISCEVLWQDAIAGTCIGNNNSLIPYDIDNDGTPELITNASASGFGNKGYWYILKYNPGSSSYDKVYVSSLFEDRIDKLVLFDLENDGTMEVLFTSDSQLTIVSLDDFSTIHTMTVPGFFSSYPIRQIRYADADNDGEKEIIVSNTQNLIFITPGTWDVELSISSLDAGDFDIGNVDGDVNLEVVFTHGLTLEFDPSGNYTEEYDFLPAVESPNGFIELSDIDGDGLEEAVIANSWYSLTTYDIDLLSPKYEIESDLDIDAFLMFDLDNDGTEEILYGDGQWGNIYAHDAATGAPLWDIDNPEHGTTGIAIGDFDNDGTLEVVWGAGCSSTGSDYLFFHSTSNLQFEWQTKHIDGPFTGIEVVDVDQDGDLEIITISYESESGYDSGILTIYDANTKAIEFQSDGNFFNNVWTGTFNIEIADYANDGDLDIIVAAGQTYNGKLWVVDGNSYNIEVEHLYDWQDDVDEFYALEVADIDNDNTLEFLVVNQNKFYIINSLTFEIEWSSVSLAGSGIPKGILAGNLDSDAEEEIVVCKSYIYRYDNTTYTQAQSVNDGYTAIKLYDWDGDGEMEILAGMGSGFVQVLDGVTLDVLEIFALGSDSEAVGGIEVADLNNDGTDELLITAGSQMIFMKMDGELLASQDIISNLGTYDALSVLDYDGDGEVNILLGSQISVMELNPSCSQCLWFEANISGVDPLCDVANGVIIGTSPDPTTNYTILGDNIEFTDSISNLAEGTYLVNAVNDDGCSTQLSITLDQTVLLAETISQDKTCFGPDDGIAYVSLQEATYPISVNWSTGANQDTISSLPPGEYSVSITDAAGCEFFETVLVDQSFLQSDLNIIKPACENTSNGAANVAIQTGTGSYEYSWDSNPGGSAISNLSSGQHTVSIVDALGCSEEHTFTIDSTVLIVETDQITAACNDDNDGAASVMVIDGTTPFEYQWSNSLGNNNLVQNLNAGTYYVTVEDGNQCLSFDSVTINESVLDLEIASTDLDCFGDTDGNATVFVLEGATPYTYQWQDGSTSNSINGLEAGSYFVLVQDSVGCSQIENVVITSPSEITIAFTVVNDDPSTTELDGSVVATVTGGTPPYFYNWDNGGTTNTIDQLGEGSYYLLVTDQNECLSDSIAEIDMITSLSNLTYDEDIHLFPNPNGGQFAIESLELNSIVSCEIFSATGVLISEQKNLSRGVNNKYHFDLPQLLNGSYYLLINTADSSHSVKFNIIK